MNETPPWSCSTRWRRELHVDARHGDDAHDGSHRRPWRTLARATAEAGPGDDVVIHAGCYRETLAPQRGGDGPEAMLRFRAADGGQPRISGADVLDEPPARSRRGTQRIDLTRHPSPAGAWHQTLIGRPPWYRWQQRPLAELMRMLMRRGWFWQGDRRLRQVAPDTHLADGDFAISADGEMALLHIDSASGIELAVRQSGIRPQVAGLGWIALDGLLVERCAGGIAPPLHGAIDTRCGHHWLIERCEIRDCVGTGLSIGGDAAHRFHPQSLMLHGGTIVHDCRVRDCGVSGIAGTLGLDDAWIGGNHLDGIGWLDVEHAYESAAIKLHSTRRTRIVGNRIHGCRHACGIWLDWLCADSLVAGNRIDDLRTVLAGIYVEGTHEANDLRGNHVSGIRDDDGNDPPKDGFPGGNGIHSDMSAGTRIHGNTVEGCQHAGIALTLMQGDRLIDERAPSGSGHDVDGNRIRDCGLSYAIDRLAGNRIRGNARDRAPALIRDGQPRRIPAEAINPLLDADDAIDDAG